MRDKFKIFLSLSVLSLFVLFRPALNVSTPSDKHKYPAEYKSLSGQYFQHVGVKGELIHGIDVSHDQGDIDWEKVMQTDVGFVYLKATDGMTYTDPKFHSHMYYLSHQKELLYGAYHFFEVEDDPEKQAENYIQQVSTYSPDLCPMVNIEVSKDQNLRVVKKSLKKFLEKVKEGTGCLPIICSSRNFWELDIGPSFDQYVFWLSDYVKIMDAPKKVKNLVLWQYSEMGVVNGISGPVDLDVIINGEDGLKDIRCTK